MIDHLSSPSSNSVPAASPPESSAVPPVGFWEAVRPWRERIDVALAECVAFGDGCPARLRAAIEHSLLAPGKRLRPLLVLMAAEACGSSIEPALPAACAVELVHTYSLIHDDLPAMDDDDLRRGRPTCHKAFDEATAILAGDALLARAFEVIASSRHTPCAVGESKEEGTGYVPATAARCCAELARSAGATQLVGGQADDLAAEGLEGDLAQLEAIHRRKTGAMFLVSLRLGAIVAEATEMQLAALDLFGRKLGLAFQIADDLLDAQGNAAALAKNAGQDRTRGKLTFPALLGVAESRRRAEELVNEACAAVKPFGVKALRLEALARYIVERTGA